MSEETTTADTTEAATPDTGTDAEVDPRKSPAFKAVLKQLEAANSRLAELEKTKSDEAEKARLRELEDQKNWKGLEAEYQRKLDESEARFENAKIQNALAMAGVRDQDHLDFLTIKFRASDAEKIDEWIPTARESDSLKVFFGISDAADAPGAPPAPGGAAAGRGGKSYTKEDLRNPATAKAAARWFEDYVGKHGKKPW